ANPDFSLVRDIAKAQKHGYLTRGSPQVSAAAQVETRAFGWGKVRWDEGRRNGPPQVVVEMDSGELRVVETVLERALEFLEGEMNR
ncbi:hypothetical protein NL474_29175, partial [Klebsiella pneumoniae]|nr:hypothetical protein [Klebsiella pneumoniae]